MSKDKTRISRKRFCKLLAADRGMQVPEVQDMVRRVLIAPEQREQEARQTAQHRKEKP